MYQRKSHHTAQPRVTADYGALLKEALEKPGKLNQAYSRFHNYSMGNIIWVWSQCISRGLDLGPIATFNQWKTNGRTVRKGEHALMMSMPVLVHSNPKKTADAAAEDASDDGAQAVDMRRIFVTRRNWFLLSQTEPAEGAESAAEAERKVPGFDLAKAMAELQLKQEAFEDACGNKQGYSYPNRGVLAVSPIASDPLKTTIHEMAHCLLHSDKEEIVDGVELDRGLGEVEAEGTAYIVCASLGVTEHLDTMRGYIQAWYDRSDRKVEAKNARRIFAAADRILRAGKVVETAPIESPAEETEEPLKMAA
ncbi:MAG TPA: ArdC-like ssDNA-binding domain-containing protein [Nevskiaceae bacterium]|nr:ArdC-like ssDNA-binding domain-containing protein [Nevskiaceae bacterium]